MPAFRSFCLVHQEEIRELIAERLVQTNEVGRSACLLPAFTLGSRMAHGRPLALVEVGASVADLTDAEWECLRHYLPSPTSRDSPESTAPAG